MSCPFCNINEDKIIAKNKFSYAIYDKYPVNKGHILIISKEHIRDYFDASTEVREAIFDLMEDCKSLLDNKYNPNGYNIGFNCGKEAGQTIMHFHLHLIPRYEGDIEDPTGGVRGVIPEKRVY
ncbi:MAG TPA: HIT family protein [Halanaerobiales bacterium]|nr:HIT family protein [Halanaerobiales bacterium]